MYGIPPAAALAPAELPAQLLHLVLIALLALGAGVRLATLLRRRGWRWTWALAGLPVAEVVWLADRDIGGALLATLLSAAPVGHRWQTADRRAGGDLLVAADSAHGPVAALRSFIAARRGPGRYRGDGDGLTVGHDCAGRRVRIPMPEVGGSHTLIVGATGSGKTVSQSWVALRAIERGCGVIVVDPKGDDGLRQVLRDAARAHHRAFLEWTPEGPLAYNPYGRGTDTEIADKALAGELYTEPHYQRQAQRYLGHAVRALRTAGQVVTPAALLRCLDPIQLEVLGRRLPEDAARTLWRYLDSLTARQHSDLAGTRDRLAVLVESDLGRWLDPEQPQVSSLDLSQAVAWRAVTYLRLDADRRPLAAQMLAASLVQDLLTTVSEYQARPTPTLVVLDEFSALAARQVPRLFARARSAGFSLVLGTQELSDLRAAGGDTLVDQVLGNLGALIAHRQVVPESAELLAGVAGTHGAWIASEQFTRGPGWRRHTGRTRSRGREYAIHPDQLKSLPCGVAAVIVPAGGQKPCLAQMLHPGS
ncbi:MAG TPA: type IV secretion system DNA-binding domain-containing protein [Solirubrobacteraceae bacterium]|jgi:hypothetical protein|nr:type IV secretion system DNA-binding domain-containing protein [Solirubrobacteraceae bacterium]